MIADSVKPVLDERLANLLRRSSEELIALPNCATEAISRDGTAIRITTYRETLEDGKQRIVVQATRQRWAGLTATVQAVGFEITSDGVRRMLTREELYDFS